MVLDQFLHELSLLYQSLTFRAVFIFSVLLLFPYFVYLAIDILVVSNYNPESFGPKSINAVGEFLPSVILDPERSLLIDSAGSLPQSLPQSQRIISRFPGSPTPESDDYLAFNRKLFYQNLNNSSQYLRRDSFS